MARGADGTYFSGRAVLLEQGMSSETTPVLDNAKKFLSPSAIMGFMGAHWEAYAAVPVTDHVRRIIVVLLRQLLLVRHRPLLSPTARLRRASVVS